MATLYEQYTQAGQALPSVQERQPLAQQAGIQNYSGTAEQNTTLGNYISTNKIDLSKPIKMADIGGTSGTLPTPAPDNTNYAGIISGIQGGLTAQQTADATKKQADADLASQAVKQYFGSANEPSSEDLFAQTRQGLGITEKEQKVNDLTAQLNQIVAESQAGQLQQEGRLASMGAISGSQRDIERQAAIRALPIQAQLSAAQGNLQTAQSNLETLFKLKSEDAERKYNRESEIRKFVYQFATDKEKRELDAQQREEDMAFEREMLDYKNELEQETLKFKAGLENNGLDSQYKALQIQKLRQELGATTFDGFLDETEVKKIDASPQGKKVKALGELKQKVQGYKELVEKYGTETPLGGQKTVLDAAFADLKIAYKEAANLGALTGPDVQLLEEAVKPAGFGGFFGPLKRVAAVVTRQGQGAITRGIDQTLEIINKNATKNISELYARDPRYSSSYYVNEITQPFADVITLTDTQLDNLLENLSEEQLRALKAEGLIQ